MDLNQKDDSLVNQKMRVELPLVIENILLEIYQPFLTRVQLHFFYQFYCQTSPFLFDLENWLYDDSNHHNTTAATTVTTTSLEKRPKQLPSWSTFMKESIDHGIRSSLSHPSAHTCCDTTHHPNPIYHHSIWMNSFFNAFEWSEQNILFSSHLDSPTNDNNSNSDANDTDRNEALKNVQTCILYLILHHAMKNSFVFGKYEEIVALNQHHHNHHHVEGKDAVCSTTEDPNMDWSHFLLFMEAVFALTGIQGTPQWEIQVIHSTVQSILFLLSSSSSMTLTHSYIASSFLPSNYASIFMDLLYRLALSSHVLLQSSENVSIRNHQDQIWETNPLEQQDSTTIKWMPAKDLIILQQMAKKSFKDCNFMLLRTKEYNIDKEMKRTKNLDVDSGFLAMQQSFDVFCSSLFAQRQGEKQEEPEQDGKYHTNKKRIDQNDLWIWIETSFPQMANILSTFFHSLFLSWYHIPRDYVDSIYSTLVTGGDDATQSDVHLNTAPWNAKNNLLVEIKNDSDENSNFIVSKMSKNALIYALGKRNMFTFPTFEHVSLSNLPVDSTVLKINFTSNLRFQEGATSDILATHSFSYLSFGTACMSPILCGKWRRLYSSNTDGFAFINMHRALTGYNGPTITLIQPAAASVSPYPITSTESSNHSTFFPDIIGKSDSIFGFYTTNPWMESTKFYGSASDCFLFRLLPAWNVYLPCCMSSSKNVLNYSRPQTDQNSDFPSFLSSNSLKAGENYMYLSPAGSFTSSTSNIHYKATGGKQTTKPRGLVLGGTEEYPRLYITESLENCIASNGGFGKMSDRTYESGPLLPGEYDKYFNVDVLEVWGLGSDEVIIDGFEARHRAVDMIDSRTRKVQLVNKKLLLNDFHNGIMMTSKLFSHRQDSSERCDLDCGDALSFGNCCRDDEQN